MVLYVIPSLYKYEKIGLKSIINSITGLRLLQKHLCGVQLLAGT